jgi:hypothetical protein
VSPGMQMDGVGIVRCIEKLLIVCASMSYNSCYDALKREIDSCSTL